MDNHFYRSSSKQVCVIRETPHYAGAFDESKAPFSFPAKTVKSSMLPFTFHAFAKGRHPHIFWLGISRKNSVRYGHRVPENWNDGDLHHPPGNGTRA